MRFDIPTAIIQQTTGESLAMDRSFRKVSPSDLETASRIRLNLLKDEDIKEIRNAAFELGAQKWLRAFDAALAVRDGTSDYKVPTYPAFMEILSGYLRSTFIRGWIFEDMPNGEKFAWAITAIKPRNMSHSSRDIPAIELHATAYGAQEGRLRRTSRRWAFEPGDVSRRHISKILEKKGLHVETEALIEEYEIQEAGFQSLLKNGFAEQFRVRGPILSFKNNAHGRDRAEALGAKVVMDLDEAKIMARDEEVETGVYGSQNEPEFLTLPCHPGVEVFNLGTHESFWVSTTHLEPYKYKPELKEKLILPEAQRDLLDILTSDTDMLTGDIIEGKSAGNLILAKGSPGVGKTLTAEIYAEVIARPLYSVHAGVLGTKASEIAGNLRDVLQRAKRWDCVLLLDEADVFVAERGVDIELNAIVSEFLRVLEYFDGLIFMTSNRGDNIDDAIISRCAAIIQYDAPEKAQAIALWNVMSRNFKANLSDDLIADLVEAFPQATGRDIKMLLRLTLRVSMGKDKPLDLDLFRQCAMFRGMNAKKAVLQSEAA